MNEDEKTFLKLPKSATDFTRINVESFKTNIQVMAAKLRMSLKDHDDNGAQGMDAGAEEVLLAS